MMIDGHVYKVNKTAWRARLTIAGRLMMTVPVGPWLRMRGAWWIASKRKVAQACARAGVPCPSDSEIHAAVMDAAREFIKEIGGNHE